MSTTSNSELAALQNLSPADSKSQSLAVPRSSSLLSKVVGILFGASTQLLFLWTAIKLFQFLRYGSESSTSFSAATDFAWAALFAVPHSLLLFPPVLKRLRTYVPGGLHGCVHCCVTCVSLLCLFANWTASSYTIWEVHGTAEIAMLAAFYLSWAALFYSLYLAGMGYQTGLIPWYCWIRDKKTPNRKFEIRGAFRYMRHPVYMSFLGLIWFTPRMTIDHAILTGVWTVYIYVGSYLKDRRLEHFVGQPYREYAQRVVGFPIIGFGPWGRISTWKVAPLEPRSL